MGCYSIPNSWGGCWVWWEVPRIHKHRGAWHASRGSGLWYLITSPKICWPVCVKIECKCLWGASLGKTSSVRRAGQYPLYPEHELVASEAAKGRHGAVYGVERVTWIRKMGKQWEGEKFPWEKKCKWAGRLKAEAETQFLSSILLWFCAVPHVAFVLITSSSSRSRGESGKEKWFSFLSVGVARRNCTLRQQCSSA